MRLNIIPPVTISIVIKDTYRCTKSKMMIWYFVLLIIIRIITIDASSLIPEITKDIAQTAIWPQPCAHPHTLHIFFAEN